MNYKPITVLGILFVSSTLYASEPLRAPQEGVNTFVLSSITSYDHQNTSSLPEDIFVIYSYTTGFPQHNIQSLCAVDNNNWEERASKITDKKGAITYECIMRQSYASYSKKDFKKGKEAEQVFHDIESLIKEYAKEKN